MAVFTSSMVGVGFSSSRAFKEMRIPGVQKPHWTAPSLTKASCSGWSLPFCASPSIVMISASWAVAARTRQELTGLPSSRTAVPHVAALLGACQLNLFPQDIEESPVGSDHEIVAFSINLERNRYFFHKPSSLLPRALASATWAARRQRTRIISRRYSRLARRSEMGEASSAATTATSSISPSLTS